MKSLPLKNYALTKTEFIHRHDRFKPTFANIFLLGFASGGAIVIIALIAASHIFPTTH